MRWKWLLQQTLGGLKRVPGAALREVRGGGTADGRCRSGLTAACLDALASGHAPVVVCRGAVHSDVCEAAAARLDALGSAAAAAGSGSGRRGHVRNKGLISSDESATRFSKWFLGMDRDSPSSDYEKIGYTKTDVLREEGVRMTAVSPATERYLRRASMTRQCLEDVFGGRRSPIEDMAEELSSFDDGTECRVEVCPATGRPFLPCVVRQMVPGSRRRNGNTHMDTVVPGSTISVNVYLRVPRGQGGELVLYPVRKTALDRVLNAHFFETIDIQNFYPGKSFYAEDVLVSGVVEPIVYQPQVGDIVLIDPAYPHAVRDFADLPASCDADLTPSGESPRAPRLSLQAFMQLSKRSSSNSRTRLLEYAS
eukprot:TRINITY_DN9911_c0_g3_i1.p1 TRINITY_DN9911_c0_g3~~TRINITY_DN9911_c0_g3_i1.p1  ORF type:complete len:367 (-),score=47.51 TRINITY_DN9911_c0_g3_i1:250-1350(-)